jgi:hypothetical protein
MVHPSELQILGKTAMSLQDLLQNVMGAWVAEDIFKIRRNTAQLLQKYQLLFYIV